jgi:hypothetical protein
LPLLAGTIFAGVNPVGFDVNLTRVLRANPTTKITECYTYSYPCNGLI